MTKKEIKAFKDFVKTLSEIELDTLRQRTSTEYTILDEECRLRVKQYEKRLKKTKKNLNECLITPGEWNEYFTSNSTERKLGLIQKIENRIEEFIGAEYGPKDIKWFTWWYAYGGDYEGSEGTIEESIDAKYINIIVRTGSSSQYDAEMTIKIKDLWSIVKS
jgi:hypothetical protein